MANGLKFTFEEDLKAPDSLVELIKSQKAKPERFIQLPADAEYLSVIKTAIKKYQQKNWEGIVVVGIGGSNLGTLAIWRALRGKKEIGFAETLDARRLDRILKHVTDKTLVVIVSKSGTTLETIANAAVILDKIKNPEQVVVITDENSKLWDWAKRNSFGVVPTPKEVEGRYSVFSAVGLFPLAMAGINIEKLITGAKNFTPACLEPEVAKNPAALSALQIFKYWQDGKPIHDTFIFEPDLEAFGKWYRQLTGESVGKDGKGITPTVSIGTADLHSVAQLYLGGPRDKFTTFISVTDHGKDFAIQSQSGIEELAPDLAGKKFGEMLSAIYKGVVATYKKRKIPFLEIQLAEISEEVLGALMQMKMIEMMYLGKLMKVNPFNQPEIELYKEETRRILKGL